MATHSSICAWGIPSTEEPGGLESQVSQSFQKTWACTHTPHAKRIKYLGINLPTEAHFISVSSVTHSCLTLCDPMGCSTPGFPVHHQLPELAQTPVHRVSDAIQQPNPLSSSSAPAFSLTQHQDLFQWVSSLFASDVQRFGASALVTILPMNIKDWFPLGWTGLIFLQPKGLSRVFSNITIQKHQFFSAQLSL